MFGPAARVLYDIRFDVVVPENQKKFLTNMVWVHEEEEELDDKQTIVVSEHELQQQDQFLVFSSDGLWEQLSYREAVDMFQNHPRNGIAFRLVKMALQAAAKKRK
ncbi:hypothetical protein Bca4012_036514 [Brassica carinata]